MKNLAMRECLLASTVICGVLSLGIGGVAAAETAPAATSNPGAAVQEVVVTGTRIRQPNATSLSPIQTVGSQSIELGGRLNTIDILNQLPQVTQIAGVDISSTSNALGPGGVATVDLRGLGPQRTLVLVDGKRLGVGDPNIGNTNASPDVNQVPAQLIDHVDVLTGGASAVYGSDALAGVVNLVMKKNFQGVQLDAQIGAYQHGQQNTAMQGLLSQSGNAVPGDRLDGGSRDFSLVFGHNAPDNKGNLTGYFTYGEQDPVKQGARDYAACPLAASGAVGTCSGSNNSNLFTLNGVSLYSVLGSSFAAWGTPGTTPPTLFNSNPYEDLLHASKRYTAGYLANYRVNDHVELYSTFGWMDDRTTVDLAPSALLLLQGPAAGGAFQVNCSNPFLSNQERTKLFCFVPTRNVFIGRRNIEGGGRDDYYEHANYRIVAGAQGDIVGSWKYNVYGSYYSTTLHARLDNYLSLSKIQDALLVGGTAANPVCLSGHAGCVPYDIFQQGGVTPAAAASLAELGTSTGSTTERILEGSVTGDLADYGVKSPWAAHGVALALGATERVDGLRFTPNAAEASGDLSGIGVVPSVNNSVRVREGYAEVQVPLVDDKPFAKALLVDGGYRYSDYSSGFSAGTYKAGGEWAPIPDIRLRGSYNLAIRAPSVLELFGPDAQTNTGVVSSDPCAGPTPVASQAACANTGVSAAQYGHIVQCTLQCSVLIGGNAALRPEQARTYTVGFIARPRAVPGMMFSLDYYHVDLTGMIEGAPFPLALPSCLATANPVACGLIVRGPTGAIFGTGGYLVGTAVNYARGENAGFDVQWAYAIPMRDWGLDGAGQVSLDFYGSVLTRNTTSIAPGAPAYDCAGLFGPTCAGIYPRWRHTLHVNWAMPWPKATMSLAWRFIGAATYEADSTQPGLGTGGHNAFNHSVPAVSYLDLAGQWRINDTVSLRAGVNNVLDQDPPVLPNSVAGGNAAPNTFTTYDLLGRQMFVGIRANF